MERSANLEKIKLYCLPYAGGSATRYLGWNEYISEHIEIVPLELRGRGTRFDESFYNTFEEAVEDLYYFIMNDINNGEYALFGHSMGGLLVYDLLNLIQQSGKCNPIHAFISGRYPPHIKKNKKFYRISDNDFMAEIMNYGGTPVEVFENISFKNTFLPILRADFRMIDLRKSDVITNFNLNITALGGSEDAIATYDEIIQWKGYTNKDFDILIFDGGHFFINDKVEEITNVINAKLSRYLAYDYSVNPNKI